MNAMLERPELDYVAGVLKQELSGASIRHVDVRRSIVLRCFVEGTPDQVMGGHSFGNVRRRGHFLMFELLGPHEIELVAAPMQNGFFSLVGAGTAQPRGLSVAFVLADGRELRYHDALQRGKLYVIRQGCWRQVPGLTAIGVDVLDEPVFSRSALSVLARDRRDRAKEFLLDQTVLDAIDSGYADEILWEARVHPRSLARDLSVDELERIYDAIVAILGNARNELNARHPPIDELPRDWFKIHGRAGEPCPRCGARLDTVRVLTDDAVFCSSCQPEKRQGVRIEWKRVAGAP
jgi:formamidopyrimidine-DNA glycosylase